ncbi:MAG: 50S ribosomal protein L3 [Bacilli bacterium]
MSKGILGRKVGMMSVFTETGELVPVTVIEVTPNVVTQIKTIANDGYDAIQVAFEEIREKLVSKSLKGHFAKAEVTPKRFVKEFKDVNVSDYSLGKLIEANIFKAGEIVDVTARSKGKGFQGVIKRHNQSRGPMSHGSQYHRGVGSMGTMRPARVLPGKKLPGHMGNQMKTVQNLEIIRVDSENNVILIKGNVPGPKKTLVTIKTAIKKAEVKNDAKVLVSYNKEEIAE